jgi:hypothetical protein
MIIAHRGSEFEREPFKDGVIADGGMIFTGINAQASAAQAFTERAIAKAKAAAENEHVPLHITVTGHFYGTRYMREHGERAERGAQAGAPDCRATLACLPPEPVDAAMAANVTDRHPVAIGPLPPSSLALAQTSAELSPEQQMRQELQRLQEQLHRLQSQYMPEQAMPVRHSQELPAPEHEAAAASALSVDVSAITSQSSIDDMFDALYRASLVDDRSAMSTVSQAYLQSSDGQAFLQQGREYNQQLERQ